MGNPKRGECVHCRMGVQWARADASPTAAAERPGTGCKIGWLPVRVEGRDKDLIVDQNGHYSVY